MITGCSSGGGSDAETTVVIKTEALTCKPVFYGDSIGVQLSESPDAPDFVYDVYPGRKITDLLIDEKPTEPIQTSINYSYCTIYIALGTNPHPDSELHLLQLLEGYRDKIICVLPMTLWVEEVPIREVMLRECTRTIDPLANGVYPLALDQIHLSNTDNGSNISQYSALF